MLSNVLERVALVFGKGRVDYFKAVYNSFVASSDCAHVLHPNAQCGITIAPDSSTQLDMESIDIGSPIFAMHSIRELGGVQDHHYLKRSFEEFFK